MSGFRPTSARLANGETVFVNDHVYVSPPWSDRDGTPYWVARIIEFLPSNATPKKNHSGRPGEQQVRLSLYYRPSDISGRAISDFRLLLAAIHTDTQPLSNVRGKCYVRHRDRIDDVIRWKKQPDHFYFVKFYDPYIKREFEVLRTENVHNIPTDVKETLMKRYEYLLTEREMVADLTDSFRTCCVCDEWASYQNSVRCEQCKKHYHMQCCKRPLLAKPAKGYSWVCLPCSVQRQKDVQDKKFLFGSTSAPAAAPRAKGATGTRSKDGSAAKSSTRPDVTFRGWPWRYFGLYTQAQDTLDPEDLIFCRAATRVGVKFQASVMDWEEQQAAEASHRAHGFVESEAGPSRHIAVERGHDIGERKHDPTYDVICTPSDELDHYMDTVAGLPLPVPPYDTERLDRAAIAYSTTKDEAKALEYMRASKLKDFHPIIFEEDEIETFEGELEKQGGLDTHETGKLLSRTPADVLRFSYIWKNKKLKEENEALRAHHKVTSAHARQNKTLGAPSLGRIRARDDGDPSDDEVSLYSSAEATSKPRQCAACSTKVSTVWWRCPRTVHGDAMCESCGSNYRKYGVISFVKAEDATKKPEKKDALGGVKKGGKDASSGTSTPVPPPAPKLPPCACCKRMEPKSAMARCKTCTFSAHSGCYGISSQDMGPFWECELCLNARVEDNHLEPKCVLCPKDISTVTAKVKSKKPPSDFDMLSAMKPTEGRRWAHVLCSAWIPEVIFTDPVKLKTVEGITTIDAHRWEQTCGLCNQQEGACISCADAECGAVYHASCAWVSGYKFGFEFLLANSKANKREAPTVTKFKDSAGVMNASVWCKGHDLEGRVIHDLHEIDPEQNETALQIYTASYKTLPPHDETFALLRKATQLDILLGEPTVELHPPPIKKICAHCEVDVSPLWHPLDTKVEPDAMEVDDGHQEKNGVKSTLCHLCWFRSRTPPDGDGDVDM